jgi:multidrug efflux pump subunit AcrA (membrane-fusion protein)
MKSRDLLTASALTLATFLMVQPAVAQSNSMPAGSGEHVDANGMPTTHSTPEEQAQTADLNAQVTQSNAEISAQDNNNKAKYQIQQQQYQEQLQQNQAQQEQYQDQKAAYEASTARYENLRARFAAERAAYHRDVWPDEYRSWELRPNYQLMHSRVEITNGDHVGTVTGLARSADGRVEGLEVALDSGKVVWIDSSDARFNRSSGILMTDLDRTDLHQMADERL